MACGTAAVPMTLRNLQHYSPIASFFGLDFACSCAAVDKISADTLHCTVPLL